MADVRALHQCLCPDSTVCLEAYGMKDMAPSLPLCSLMTPACHSSINIGVKVDLTFIPALSTTNYRTKIYPLFWRAEGGNSGYATVVEDSLTMFAYSCVIHGVRDMMRIASKPTYLLTVGGYKSTRT